MSYGMRVWVLPDPGGAVTHEDRQLLAIGIAYLPAPIVPYHKPGAGVGGFEYPDPYERRRKEMREIKEIVMILSELN